MSPWMLVMSRLLMVEQSRTIARRRGRAGVLVEELSRGLGMGSDQRRSCNTVQHFGMKIETRGHADSLLLEELRRLHALVLNVL